MSNVVQFLEALATSTQPLSTEHVADALAKTELDFAARQALMKGDIPALHRVLGASATVLCFIVPAENDEPEEREPSEGEEESPDQEPSSHVA